VTDAVYVKLPTDTSISLEHAIHAGQLRLDYQPQVHLKDGLVRGVEALVRWDHPTAGTLPPDSFIPMAERTGVIRQLTRWVIEQAIQQAKQWQEEGLQLKVSANLSVQDLHDEQLPDYVASKLKTWGLDPSMLELEITESMIVDDPVPAVRRLLRLRAMGIGISLDDFGMRYSSLSHLRVLPVNGIKLDRSYVTDMVADRVDARIVRSVIDLAHSLGHEVTAEGVEDMATWSQLRIHGCDMAQGFFVGRPMGSDEVGEWLASWRAPHTDPERKEAEIAAAQENAAAAAAGTTEGGRETRVLILEDHTLVRQSLVKTVSTEPGFVVIGEAGRAEEAVEAAGVMYPDLALLDISLPGIDGIDFARQLRSQHPGLRVLFLTMRDDDEAIRRAVEVGADGYVTKNSSTEELLGAMRIVASGGSYLSPSIANRVMSFATSGDRRLVG
jgi:EAL domain-containing protein (putative c-di-GMP-specific phosphodiesterase class I)/ActR/RegA family two-component response regulator